MRSQLYVALDEGYLSREEFERLFELASHTINKLGALRSYLLRVGEPT